jgi:hypothetical protein
MRRLLAYALGGLGVLLATLALTIALDVPTATARPHVKADPMHQVNRTLKGDRLPAVAPTAEEVPAARKTGMPDGCETGFSPLTRLQMTSRARLCLT